MCSEPHVSPREPGFVGCPVALLTGGGDRPYALGLAFSLIEEGLDIDFIGSDFLISDELSKSSQVRFLNLRGDMRPDVSLQKRLARVVRYYVRLIRYAASAKPRIFHILWNNKLEIFDRTLLLMYYRWLGKRLVLTVHNVNRAKRDGHDGLLNRLTLKAQYHLTHHLFVHTEQMKRELETEYSIPAEKVSVIPFGINSTVPETALSSFDARERLGLDSSHKVVLFFGNIAPYKGLEYLVEAVNLTRHAFPEIRLVIAGRPKGSEAYWSGITRRIEELGLQDSVLLHIEYVPDEQTEVYFKAADVLALPYVQVFQSGVLFLGYNFGLPVIAADIASLRADIIEGETGFVCEPADPRALSLALERYFRSDLYRDLDEGRQKIRQFARDRYSWAKVGMITKRVYERIR